MSARVNAGSERSDVAVAGVWVPITPVARVSPIIAARDTDADSDVNLSRSRLGSRRGEPARQNGAQCEFS